MTGIGPDRPRVSFRSFRSSCRWTKAAPYSSCRRSTPVEKRVSGTFRLRGDADRRPARLHRHKVGEGLVEVGEDAAVAAVTDDTVRQHDLRVAERFPERVLGPREPAVAATA